jgi:hypothetical protein
LQHDGASRTLDPASKVVVGQFGGAAALKFADPVPEATAI